MSLIEATVEGTIQSDGTLVLNNPTSLPAGQVVVVLRQETESRQLHPVSDRFFQMTDEIWAVQRAQSHNPSVVGEIHADRCEIQEQIEAAIRLREECRRRRKQTESEMMSP